jgi:hypothetical protein
MRGGGSMGFLFWRKDLRSWIIFVIAEYMIKYVWNSFTFHKSFLDEHILDGEEIAWISVESGAVYFDDFFEICMKEEENFELWIALFHFLEAVTKDK